MKNLIIIGAGDFGREVFEWASQCPENNNKWRITGFLDDNNNALNGYALPVGLVGTIADYQPNPDDVFVCAIGSPKIKKACVEKILAKGGRFVNVVHPSVVCGNNITLGQGVIACPGVIMTVDLQIGSFVSFNLNSTINHGAVVGDYCQTSCFCDITGNVKLGEGVFMGSHASILPGCSIGDYAVIGAGCIVTRDVPPNTTVVGVPGKPLIAGD